MSQILVPCQHIRWSLLQQQLMAPPIYAKSPVLVRRLRNLSSTFIYHLYYPHYFYPVKSPALAIILLNVFASKPGKIFTRNSIDSFLTTSPSVVCSVLKGTLMHISKSANIFVIWMLKISQNFLNKVNIKTDEIY